MALVISVAFSRVALVGPVFDALVTEPMLGIAMAAMPITATTMRSSTRLKPADVLNHSFLVWQDTLVFHQCFPLLGSSASPMLKIGA